MELYDTVDPGFRKPCTPAESFKRKMYSIIYSVGIVKTLEWSYCTSYNAGNFLGIFPIDRPYLNGR
jgi:hypothetical protein